MVKKVACFFCKETEQRKDVEQKIITIIIFFTSKQLKTITYTHDDDDKIKKMRFFPRPRRPVDAPHQPGGPTKKAAFLPP
ncbi:hypothetical protein RPG63_001091 [Escherichia coli]|nr:hypothetical protein [Escherichia coli]